MKRYIINIMGPMAVGKSTVIGELQEYLPQYKVFAIDEFRRKFSNGTPEGDANAWYQMYRHANSCQYIITESSGTSYNLCELIRALNNCDLQIITIALSASKEVRWERKQERQRAGYKNPPMYFLGDVGFEGSLVLPATFKLNTETIQPYEVASEIVESLPSDFI